MPVPAEAAPAARGQAVQKLGKSPETGNENQQRCSSTAVVRQHAWGPNMHTHHRIRKTRRSGRQGLPHPACSRINVFINISKNSLRTQAVCSGCCCSARQSRKSQPLYSWYPAHEPSSWRVASHTLTTARAQKKRPLSLRILAFAAIACVVLA